MKKKGTKMGFLTSRTTRWPHVEIFLMIGVRGGSDTPAAHLSFFGIVQFFGRMGPFILQLS